MSDTRIKRLNSLLKEVITEVVRENVKNPKVSELLTITEVDVSKDLSHAKVYISIIGSDQEKQDSLDALRSASGYISVLASKKVVLRHFPTLNFKLDTSVEKHMRIDSLLKEIEEEREHRTPDQHEQG